MSQPKDTDRPIFGVGVITAEALMDALGLEPGDTVRVITPQFTRTSDMPDPKAPPTTAEGWVALKTRTKDELTAMGCGCWDGRLMLFPGEWYAFIPEGLPVETIRGNLLTFAPGVTDDDIRFGCLSYGVRAIDGKVM